MVDVIKHFLSMGGYGFYIWSSYGCVLVFLIAQWFLPWRRGRQYVCQLKQNETPHARQ